MRASLKRLPETRLEHLLEALEQELLAASEEEILAAAHELGMQPHMKGSAAFLGLRYPVRPRVADFFAPGRDSAGLANPEPPLGRLAPGGEPEEGGD